MRIFILEDNKERLVAFKELYKTLSVTFCDNVKDAMRICMSEEFEILLLGHDLDDRVYVDSNEENTGYQFVKKLVESGKQKEALIYVHSLNPIGANKMVNLLHNYGYDGIWSPYNLMMK